MILIDSQPEFIIKFDQDMLQGKSIMQMAKTKKKTHKPKCMLGTSQAPTHLEPIPCEG